MGVKAEGGGKPQSGGFLDQHCTATQFVVGVLRK